MADNAIYSVIKSNDLPQVKWTQSTLDDILDKGDSLYWDITSDSKSMTYFSVDDIPRDLLCSSHDPLTAV